jgi:hypothetical protein
MKRKHKDLPKARNPFVLHLSKRLSGAHGKTKKAERRSDKMALKQEWTVS